ncbi:5'-3' exonuclease family protein [Actinidia rufa]|uniref:5'-3' exonuclease family protein n=1 Tax=Actinidia rufa TaxID=165716 RepID=A0A7J0EGV8_9ERIC|nr:5'-3' exonuclease family protein [Actinidia rufa]
MVVAMAAQVRINPRALTPTTASSAHTTTASSLPFLLTNQRCDTNKTRPWNLRAIVAGFSSSGSLNQTVGGQLSQTSTHRIEPSESERNKRKKKRVFFLDVNPLCYNGSTPSLHFFAHWISLFFSQVSLTDPVIAVVKIEEHEADDVVATLVDEVLQGGYRVVIASPDKDFKQLISEDVQIVMPILEFNRWSFYTLKHYIAQYNCYPSADLSLRCIMGDEVDGVPGIQHLAPGFGRKTALKLLKKHGSLENLLNAASVRTVGKQYAQDALTKYADYLRRNYEVLSLRRDVDVNLQEEWLSERETCNDLAILSNFFKMLEETQKLNHRNRSHSSNG